METTWEKIVSGNELESAKRERMKKCESKKVLLDETEESEKAGYLLRKELSHGMALMQKDKPHDVLFENRVWLLFKRMGFTEMNSDNSFKIVYAGHDSETPKTQQIDVFAVDEEVVICVECKDALRPDTNSSFKYVIQSLDEEQGLIKAEIIKRFPNHKIGFIFATNNYILGQPDCQKIRDAKMVHLSEANIKYFEELVDELGEYAKYQLFGSLFEGVTIPKMRIDVPAVRGTMGGFTFYSFSIEPDKLLKIGYVLHRNDGNSGPVPTYQRIIKKARLKKVQKFVADGGFFPNSIIVSVDSGTKKQLNFDLANTQASESDCRVGILHLPNRYKSAFIIDGQHRLYGYCGSNYAHTNAIPVVAFENLDQKRQVELFMQINENQKPVSKNLRNTLDADMLYDSENPTDARIGLALALTQDLGTKADSPLYGRILIGENKETEKMCIQIDAPKSALLKGGYFSQFDKKGGAIGTGLFDKTQSDSTRVYLESFLIKSLSLIRDGCPDEWQKGKSDDGILTINIGIYGLIRFFADLVRFLADQKRIVLLQSSPDEMVEAARPYLEAVSSFFRNLDFDTRMILKKAYGDGGKIRAWRTIEKAVRESFPSFNPQGLERWLDDNSKEHNQAAKQMVEAIKKNVSSLIITQLNLTDENVVHLLSKAEYKRANNRRYDLENGSEDNQTVSILDCISMTGFRELVLGGDRWSCFFSDSLGWKDNDDHEGDKNDRTSWMTKIDKIIGSFRKTNYSISSADFAFLQNCYTWKIGM